jgi:hypothetical protein
VIVKTAVGPGLTGMQRYVLGRGRDENGVARTQDRSIIIGGDGFGFPVSDKNIHIATAMMEQNGRTEMQRSKTFAVANDALHMKLSWAPGQSADAQQIREAAAGALQSIGMEGAMHTIVQHTDKPFVHAHVVASRIGPDGRAYNDSQRVYRSQEWALRWEEERNQITKERQWCHDIRAMTKGEPQNRKLAEHLFQNEATIERKRLQLYMAWGGHFDNHLESAVKGFVQDNNLLPLKKHAKGRTEAYTTEEIWREEAAALATSKRLRANAGFEVPKNILDDVAKEMTLTPEQRQALHHATRDNGMGIIVGKAGSGKSHTMMAIRKAYERAGFPVKGLAETNRVVQQMQADGFEASTIASEVMRLKFRPGQQWQPKSVVAIDEAGQMETARLKEMVNHIEKQGAKPLFIGDPGQLGAVGRGGLLQSMIREHSAAKLTEVMRTRHADQKQAYTFMSKRRYREAVNIFKEDSIKWSDTKEQSIKALVDEYRERMKSNPKGMTQIIAGTNDEVKRINDEVRVLWKADGKIKNEHTFETSKGPRTFGVGDRIAMTETPNAQDKKKGLVNGVFGSITGINVQSNGQKEVAVEIDRKKDQQRRQFRFNVGMNKDEGEVAGIDHGYAGTIYKAQGSTYDHTLKLHNPKSTAPTHYVGLTRHKEKVSIFVSRDETSHHDELIDQLKHGNDKTAAHDYFVNRDEMLKERPIGKPSPQKEPEPMPSIEPLHDDIKEWIQHYSPSQGGEVGKELQDQTLATAKGLEVRKKQTSRGRSL